MTLLLHPRPSPLGRCRGIPGLPFRSFLASISLASLLCADILKLSIWIHPHFHFSLANKIPVIRG